MIDSRALARDAPEQMESATSKGAGAIEHLGSFELVKRGASDDGHRRRYTPHLSRRWNRIARRPFAPDMPPTSLNNLALLLQAQGNLAAARPLFKRALVIREKLSGITGGVGRAAAC